MKYNTRSMFDSIKKSLQETDKNQNSKFSDFLRLTSGNTYTVRLVPNVNSPENTFFHYYHYGWNSTSTGQYVEVLSPKTWGDPDPIEVERIKLYRNKSDTHAIELAKLISTKEKWLVNVYVIDDPVNPDNNGTVKVLRYGAQLGKIITAAIDGHDADDLGPAIFDLSENGCNLRIKVESTKEGKDTRAFVNYTSSRFSRPAAIPNMTAEKTKEVLNSVHDLTSYFGRKSPSELKDILAVHLYGRDETNVSEDKPKIKIDSKVDVESESESDDSQTESKDEPTKKESTGLDIESDDKIKALLAGLD